MNQSLQSELGHWAIIDLETTGIDAASDAIIEIAYLKFQGDKLLKKFSSLVKTDIPLSHFLQKLTGITPQMLVAAPTLEKIMPEVLEDLQSCVLVAHNASFEENFLKAHLPGQRYLDSMIFLGMLFPGRSKLNLDSFIREFSIRSVESHRALDDCEDLLQVLIASVKELKLHRIQYEIFLNLAKKNSLHGDWWIHFLQTDLSQYEVVHKVDTSGTSCKEPSSTPLELNSEFSAQAIQEIFAQEEVFKSHFSNFKNRTSQVAMSLKIGQSFKNGIHSLIQAPTGTGKTFAYLIPTFLWSILHKNKVVISTATKALQLQLLEKDIPVVQRLLTRLPRPPVIQMLVGSGNHLCEFAFLQLPKDTYHPWALFFFDWLFALNKKQGNINRTHLSFALKRQLAHIEEIEKLIAVDAKTCIGHLCNERHHCTYYQGIQAAKDADILIVNHHLFFDWPKAIPLVEYAVIDEAHHLEDRATDAAKGEMDLNDFMSLIRSLKKPSFVGPLYYLISEQKGDVSVLEEVKLLLTDIAQVAEEDVTAFKILGSNFFKKSPHYQEVFNNELFFSNNETLPIEGQLMKIIQLFSEYFKKVVSILSPFEYLFSELKVSDSNNLKSSKMMMQTNFNKITDAQLFFQSYVNADHNQVRTLNYLPSRDEFKLVSTPLDIGNYLLNELWSKRTSVVLTSATLAIKSGDSELLGPLWSSGYYLVPPNKRFKSVTYLPQVYDVAKNAQLYLVPEAKSISDPQFVLELVRETTNLIRTIGGKTLFLFSARTRFERACELLLEIFRDDIPIFIQGMHQTVIEDFKASEKGILVGMESFSEGIDVPGKKISLVVIDKIPDMPMDIVTRERRNFFQNKFGDEFHQNYLATRARMLTQKMGRLIRSEQDRGVILIVDARVKKWKSKTIQFFESLLLPYSVEQVTYSEFQEKAKNYLNQAGAIVFEQV